MVSVGKHEQLGSELTDNSSKNNKKPEEVRASVPYLKPTKEKKTKIKKPK